MFRPDSFAPFFYLFYALLWVLAHMIYVHLHRHININTNNKLHNPLNYRLCKFHKKLDGYSSVFISVPHV